MTCWSCTHYATDGIQCQREGWPNIGPRCDAFVYDPGSDECERDKVAVIRDMLKGKMVD
jgi:hypothetical protein